MKLNQLSQNKTVKLKLRQLSQNKTVKLKLPQLSQNKSEKLKQNQLSPFPQSSFPSCFHRILGIDFTYHPNLYLTHSSWIDDILPTIQILRISFRLQYVCLLSHRDIAQSCPLQGIISCLVYIAPAWYISIHTLSSSSVGDNISCFRSLLYF